MNDLRHFTPRSAGALWLALLLWFSAGGARPAQAQQGELPAGAPESAPTPLLPTPLGAGAGANGSPTRPTAPPQPRPRRGADTSASLPGAGNNGMLGATSTSSDDGSAALFGGAGGGKAAVSSVTRRVPYSFGLNLGGTFDDNTSLSQGGGGADFYFTIAPTFVFGLDNLVSARGNYLHFTYSPVVSLYVISSENDAVQHLISLDAQYHFGQFAVSARQSVQILDGTDTAQTNPGPGALLQPGQSAGTLPVYSTGTINQANLDVGARSQLDIYTTSLNVSYAYSIKTAFSAGLQYSVNAYSDLISSQNLVGNLFVDYVYSLKTVIGAGLTGGHTFVDDPSPDQNFLQTNLRTSYRYSSSLSFAGSAGVEFRRSDDQSGVDITPVFELSATLRASDSTNITLAATRSVQSSAVLAGQNFQSTGLTIGVQQLINSRLSVGLTLGYENSHYVSVVEKVRADRDESYFTAQPSLSISLRPGLALNLYYLHRQSYSSGGDSRSFSNNQAGFSLAFAF